jgi:hypothetical protein
LLIGDVVAPLELIPGSSALIRSYSCSTDKTGGAANCSAGSHVTGSGTDCRSQSGPHNRTEDGPAGSVLIGSLAWRRSAYLLQSPLPARIIISLEYLERLSKARIHRDGRAAGHRCASTEQGQSQKYKKTPCPVHFVMFSFPG